MEPMLKVTDLAVSYGHVEALRGISIEVQKGQIVSIIGANGAGKTTPLRVRPCPANPARSWAPVWSMFRKAANAFPA